jgi:hypothetical protein
MSIRSEELKQLVQKVSALLSTHNGGQPYASLVAFALSNDLGSLYFATPRTTCKFSSLQRDCRMALLITKSTNKETDFHGSRGFCPRQYPGLRRR